VWRSLSNEEYVDGLQKGENICEKRNSYLITHLSTQIRPKN